MGKIRKSLLRRKIPSEQNKAPRPRTEETWDVHKEGFYRDEIDDWHEMKDHLLLDTIEPASFSEDDSEEEVLPLDLSDSDKEQEADDVDDVEETDDEEEEETGPSDKAWGHRKNDFYSTDYIDDEGGYSSGVSEAEEEEKEALSLQRRMTEELSKEDFGLDYLSTMVGGEEEVELPIIPETSTMSEQGCRIFIQEHWPEFLELYQDLKEKAEYVNDVVEPLKAMASCGILSQDGVQYITCLSTLHHLFCLNTMFYLTLRANGVSVEDHPVITRIVQLRELLGTMRDCVSDEEISQLIDAVDVAAIESSESKLDDAKTHGDLKRKNERENSSGQRRKRKKVEVEQPKVDDEDPLEYYNRIKRETEQRKQKRVTFKEDVKDEKGDTKGEEDEMGRRPITYQISKNKGLTPKRKKEQRNPRVKHRNKYTKAMSKHRHTVRPVEREMSRYGGELGGIKSRLSRSVRIK